MSDQTEPILAQDPKIQKAEEIIHGLLTPSLEHAKNINDPRIRQEEVANKLSALGLYASFLKSVGKDREALEKFIVAYPDQKQYIKEVMMGLKILTEHVDLFEEESSNPTSA